MMERVREEDMYESPKKHWKGQSEKASSLAPTYVQNRKNLHERETTYKKIIKFKPSYMLKLLIEKANNRNRSKQWNSKYPIYT